MIIPLLILGFAQGLLTNWLADSLPDRSGLRTPYCPICDAPRPTRAWSGFISLLSRSWRCSYCRSPRSARWLIVEAAAIVFTVWAGLSGAGPSSFAAAFLVWAIFLLVTVIDIEHRLILHVVSLPSIVVVAALHSLDPARGPAKTLLGGAVGFVLVYILYLLGGVFSRWVARRRGTELDEIAFGFGDVTLATLIGVAIGWPGVVLALMIGVLLAGGFSLAYVAWMMVRSEYLPFLPIPYGPFLITGAMLVYYGGSQLFSSLLLG